MGLSGQRFLVTGGAGFIGSHIVDRLLSEGATVRAIDNLTTGHLSNLPGDAELIRGSILDADLLVRAADGCAGIFHLAAIVSVPLSVEKPVEVDQVNTSGTLQVLEAARKVGARVVFSSSAAVYGDDPSLPKQESSLTLPVSPYGVQKLAGEMYLSNYFHLFGVRGVALRYFNVYGPRQDPSSPYSGVITVFCKRALGGQDIVIFGDGEQTRDFVFVDDVVNANLLAMTVDAAPAAVCNIGSGKAISMNSLANQIIEAAGSKSKIVHHEPRAGDIVHSLADIARAGSLLGFKPSTSFRLGLERTVGSFRG